MQKTDPLYYKPVMTHKKTTSIKAKSQNKKDFIVYLLQGNPNVPLIYWCTSENK